MGSIGLAPFQRAGQQKPLVSLCVPVYGMEGLIGRFFPHYRQKHGLCWMNGGGGGGD